MKCQYCNKNDAKLSFVVYIAGSEHEIHLCESCTKKLRQYTEAAYSQHMQGNLPQAVNMWLPTVQVKQRSLGGDAFPSHADQAFVTRRKLNELRTKLTKAIDTEQYEMAAGIRDQIQTLESVTFTKS